MQRVLCADNEAGVDSPRPSKNSKLTVPDVIPGVFGRRVAEHSREPPRKIAAIYALGRKADSDTALGELIAKYHTIDAYEIAEIYAFRNSLTKRSGGWTKLMPSVMTV